MARRSRRGSGRTPSSPPAAGLPSGGLFIGDVKSSVPADVAYGGSGQGYDAVSASTMRGYIYWPQLDTQREIQPQTRIEIMRRARALTENVGLASHIIEGLADLIGYITPMGATLDREWNALANANFRDRQSNPEVFDAAGKFNFWEYQLKLDESAFRDGDVLAVLTSTQSDTARIATYEAHQIGNPYGLPVDNTEWRDGVKLNRFNRHLAYNLTNPRDRTQNTPVQAKDALYYGHFKKIGHVRPVSILRAAINHLIDMAEIVRDVKYGIKVRNQIPLTLEHDVASQSFSGGAAKAVVGQIRQGSRPGIAGDGSATTDSYSYEEIMNGGNIPRLPPGAKLKAIIDAAPHPNQLALLDFMVRDIAWGAGLPPEILWDINSLRGANNRLLNAIVQRWIGARLFRKRNFCRRFWVYHCAKEMKAGRLRECRDPEWWKVGMLPQASITADKGREGKLNIELVANRLMSLQTYFALDGLDWLSEIRQMSEEDTQLRDLGLVVGDIAKKTPAIQAAEAAIAPDAEDPAAAAA